MMYYTVSVKLWALATAAYSKEISNESCREASKALVMNSHSALKV